MSVRHRRLGLSVVMMLVVAACQAPQQQTGQAPSINKPVATTAPTAAPAAPVAAASPAAASPVAGASPAAASPAAAAAAPAQPKPAASGQVRQLNIATATVGGLYYPMGAAMAQLFTGKIPGVNATAQATAGTPQNINLLEKGDADIAIGQAGVFRDAYLGQGDFNGRPQKSLRAITYLYPNVVQFVARTDSGVKRMPDFRGKRFVPGAAGSANEVNSREIFEIYGLDYRKSPPDVIVNYADVNASIDAMKNRQADGAQLVGGIPFGGLIDLWTSVDVLIVPIDEPDRLQAMKDKYPHYYEFTITKGTYTQQQDDVNTVAVSNFLVTTADLPDDLIYQITKEIHENVETLAQTHSVARNIKLEEAQTGVTVPLHPGAGRYYRERGLQIRPFRD